MLTLVHHARPKAVAVLATDHLRFVLFVFLSRPNIVETLCSAAVLYFTGPLYFQTSRSASPPGKVYKRLGSRLYGTEN